MQPSLSTSSLTVILIAAAVNFGVLFIGADIEYLEGFHQ